MRTASTELAGLIALLAVVLSVGCARQPSAPPPPPPPPPPPLTEWPKGLTPPLKITDQLTLEIPLQYQRTAIDPGHTPRRAFISQQSDRSEAQFDFFLPDYSGYTLQNYQNDSDPEKVEVAYLHAGNPHESDPDAPGEYPPNMLQRSLKELLDPKHYHDQYGLRCYEGRVPSSRLTCFGRRTAAGEDIMLTTLKPPYPADLFPQLQARYFSQRYGGVRIAWRTHVKNLPRWHAIDAQIWKFIDAWKVSAPEPAGNPRP
jgi:hypothetical protein